MSIAANLTDITTAETTFFALGVKNGPKGRKVFRADSASTGDKGFMIYLAMLTAKANPGLEFFIVDAKDRSLSMRPNSLRLMDSTEV